LGKIGWIRDAWRHAGYASGLMSIGTRLSTPVTDGERLYIATGCSSFWCFDLEGKVIWGVATKTAASECANAKSPLIYKNLFISDIAIPYGFSTRTPGNLVQRPDKDPQYFRAGGDPVGDQDLLLPCRLKVLTPSLYGYRWPADPIKG